MNEGRDENYVFCGDMSRNLVIISSRMCVWNFGIEEIIFSFFCKFGKNRKLFLFVTDIK